MNGREKENARREAPNKAKTRIGWVVFRLPFRERKKKIKKVVKFKGR